MPDAKAYLRRIKHYGSEMVLETACRDHELTDAEYQKVWEEIAAKLPGRAGRVEMNRWADRDYARQVTANG